MFSCHLLLLRDWIYADTGCSAVASLCLCIIAPAELILQVIACELVVGSLSYLDVCVCQTDHCRWTQQKLESFCTLKLPRPSGSAAIERSMSSAGLFEAAGNLLVQVSACKCN